MLILLLSLLWSAVMFLIILYCLVVLCCILMCDNWLAYSPDYFAAKIWYLYKYFIMTSKYYFSLLYHDWFIT